METGTKNNEHTYLGLHDNHTILALVAIEEMTFDHYYDMLSKCLKENQTLYSVSLDFKHFKQIADSGLEPRYLADILANKSYKTLKKLERK